MKVQEIMTTAVECCTPSDTAHKAADFMREADAGVVPVIMDGGLPEDKCAVRVRARSPGITSVRAALYRSPVIAIPHQA